MDDSASSTKYDPGEPWHKEESKEEVEPLKFTLVAAHDRCEVLVSLLVDECDDVRPQSWQSSCPCRLLWAASCGPEDGLLELQRLRAVLMSTSASKTRKMRYL